MTQGDVILDLYLYMTHWLPTVCQTTMMQTIHSDYYTQVFSGTGLVCRVASVHA